jgi:hypothetical protein
MTAGRSDTNELGWIFAIAKAEGAVSNRSPDARELVRRLREQQPSPAARLYLADFIDRHKFEFVDAHRPPRAKRRLRQWAANRKVSLIASLRSDNHSRQDAPRLAVLLRELKLEKVKGRPKIAAYFDTDVDAKLAIGSEEYRVQRWLGVAREAALKIAAEKHHVTVEALRAFYDGKSS